MSWNEYVSNLEKSGCCYAGIFSRECAMWAQSASSPIQVQPEQVKKIVDAMRTGVQGQSFILGDKKVMCIRGDDQLAVFKQISGEGDKVMVTVALTVKGVLLGVAPGGESEKTTTGAIAKLCDYLRSVDY